MKKITKAILNLDSNPIYIAGHIKPDQDSVCSSIALAMFLNSTGKKAYVLLEDTDLDILDWKKDYSLIKSNINEKNYNFIALDVNEKSRLGKYQTCFDNAQYTINIDHHQDNKNEADLVFSDTNSSSTCEMIFNIIEDYNKNLFNIDICEYLYSGILNDTNGFARRISSKTMSISQKLINSGINYGYIIKETFTKRSMYEFKALAKLINEIKYDQFHYVIVDKSKDEFKHLTHNQIVKRIAEDLRKIEGLDIFILLIKENDLIVGKCMTNVSENANKIAQLFNGGGHKKEAGFTIKSSISAILKTIKTYITSQS